MDARWPKEDFELFDSRVSRLSYPGVFSMWLDIYRILLRLTRLDRQGVIPSGAFGYLLYSPPASKRTALCPDIAQLTKPRLDYATRFLGEPPQEVSRFFLVYPLP